MDDNYAQASFQIINMLRALIDNAETQSNGRREIIKSIEKMSADIKHSNDVIQMELSNLNKNISNLSSSIEKLTNVLSNTSMSSGERGDQAIAQPSMNMNSAGNENLGQVQEISRNNNPSDGLNITINIDQQPNAPPQSSLSSRGMFIPLFSSTSNDMSNEEMEILANILAQTLGHQEHRL